MTDSKHICNLCSKSFKSSANLVAHLRNLHKDKPTIVAQEVENIRKEAKNKSKTNSLVNIKSDSQIKSDTIESDIINIEIDSKIEESKTCKIEPKLETKIEPKITSKKDIKQSEKIIELNNTSNNMSSKFKNSSKHKVFTNNDLDMNDSDYEIIDTKDTIKYNTTKETKKDNKEIKKDNKEIKKDNKEIKKDNLVDEIKKVIDPDKFPKGSRINPNKIIIDTTVCDMCNATFDDVEEVCNHLNTTICGKRRAEKNNPSQNRSKMFKERLAQELQKYQQNKDSENEEKSQSTKKKHIPYNQISKEDWYMERKIRYSNLVNTVKSFFHYTIDMVDVLSNDNNYLDNETSDILKARIRQCINIMDL